MSKSGGEILDELQQETEKLNSLLRDRQTGTMTWNFFFRERIEKLHELTSEILGK